MTKRYSNSRKLKFAGFLLIIFFGLNMSAQTVRYVKQGGTGDGSSWTNATGSLQSAIDGSSSGWHVYVAAGTYQPALGQSFSMKEGVKIYGGFAPTGNPVFAERNWTANITVLQGNNAAVIVNDTNGVTNAALLDGFTITNGSGGQGGGMFNHNTSPTLTNLIVKNNYASAEGGGLYFNNGSPVITNVAITSNILGTTDNASRRGGGLYTYDSFPVLTNVLVANNTILGTGGLGGGLSFLNSSPSILNVTVAGNSAATGAGFYSQNGTPQIKNSIVYSNAVVVNGGTPAWYNSIVQGSGGSTAWNGGFGTNNGGNLDADAIFINAAGADYRLSGTSPARNTGNTALFANAATSIDFSGQPRLYGAAIDMGAYEHQSDPPTAQAQSFCGTTTVANLLATGTDLKWYSALTGGAALAANSGVTSGTYYVSQTLNGYESSRIAVSVTVNPLPSAPVASAQNFCGPATVASLMAEGTNIKWYSQATGGTALSTSATLVTGTYYVTQTVGCESLRTPVSVGAYSIPSAPYVSPQLFTAAGTIANLYATGSNIKWYSSASGGTPLSPSTPIATTTYYASQTVNGCEGPRTEKKVYVVTSSVIYVKKNATGTGNSWNNAMGEVYDALKLASQVNVISPGTVTQIWVAGGTYKPLGAASTDRFDIVKDVKMYGHFAGNETTVAERDLNLTANESILSGDRNGDDVYSSGNTSDNTPTVVDATNAGAAVVDGFTISYAKTLGMAVLLTPIKMRNMTFKNNWQGLDLRSCLGAEITNLKAVSNNLYGLTTYNCNGLTVVNALVEKTTVISESQATKIINSTLAGGLSCTVYPITLQNSIVRGNLLVPSGSSATVKNNILPFNLSSSTGNIVADPLFTNESAGDYSLQANSPAKDSGNTAFFANAATSTDLANNIRLYGAGIDMGAYEIQSDPPQAAPSQLFCGQAVVAYLSASGSNIKWYANAVGGQALQPDDQVVTGNYYVSQTINGSESGRTTVAVTIIPIPEAPAAPAQNFCGPATVADLVAVGTSITWYSQAEGGEVLPQSEVLTNGTYYASQTVMCEGPRTAVAVSTYTPLPSAPSDQVFNTPTTVAGLLAQGTDLKWYTSSSDGTPLDPSAPLSTGTYFVSQTLNGCESSRTAVSVVVEIETVNVPIRYVKTIASGSGDGTSWENASNDIQEMIDVSEAGNQIWVAAGTYLPGQGQPFLLKNGVAVYGGFPATGNPGMADRNFTANETILFGSGAGVVTGANLTFSTVFDGFTISGGQRETGGGLYLEWCTSVRVGNLIVKNNTATDGGGIALAFCASSLLYNIKATGNTCSNWGAGIYFLASLGGEQLENIFVTGNMSGNPGGGIAMNGSYGIVIKNALISGNSASYASGIYALYSSARITNATVAGNIGSNNAAMFLWETSFTVENSIIQGSMSLGNQQTTFTNSLVEGSGGSGAWTLEQGIDGGGNLDAAPMFTNPAEGNYSLQPASSARNAGNTALFANAATAKDLAGNPRVLESSIDMGAYESGVVSPASNIRYVKQTASGNGNGSSWANASDNLQAMIDLQVDQVWVAAGTYQRGEGQFFMLKNGVKVYGGFPATGNPVMADRNFTANETTLQGNNAVVVYGASLSSSTVFDGFTITGGQGEYGGGMDIEQSSLRMENLVVKNNTAGFAGGMLLLSCTSYLKNISIFENTSTGFYGGLHIESSTGEEYMENVIVRDNTSEYSGGGVSFSYGGRVHFVNLLVSGNTSSWVGGIMAENSSVRLTNATVSGNISNSDPALYSNDAQSFIVENSIINGGTVAYGAPVLFTNSLVRGSGGSTSWNGAYGTNNGGNIDTDPMFTNAASGNYSLQAGSPAVNAGSTSLFANAATSTDLAGNERLYGSAVDMGAYEYKPLACGITTVWDGTGWSNGTPVSYGYSAVINGNYNSTENGNMTACSLTVNSGDVVIEEGDNFTIKGAVTVDNDNVTFTIQHNANLIQSDDVDNIGTINVIKESAPMYRLDYALWSSPVAGQKLKAFSPQTLDNRFYSYNPLSDAYATIQAPATTDFAEGKSYLIRVSNTHPAYVSDAIAPTRWEGTFIGVPNNGNVDVPVTGMANGINGYNGIGNPYPSSINIAAFFEANQNNLAEDSPIYFWRKKNDANTSSYASLTLAGYNQNSGNAFGDSSNGVFDNPNDSENWVINPGQGFIVQATGNTVTFNNEMRVAVNNGQMFRSVMDASDKSRLWLNLTNGNGAFGQATIAYTPFTTLGRDFGWDGKALTDGEIAIYSLAGENKFGIQARPAFNPSDEVPMEYKITTAGNYTISLDHFDGVFAEGQKIYLRDNILGVSHNLENPYEFTTDAGIITGRFDVVYAEALDTNIPEFNANSIIVYKQGSAINISSGNSDMQSVAVYDMKGRLLYSAGNINASRTSITTLQAEEQMLIIQVSTVDGVKAGRKIIF